MKMGWIKAGVLAVLAFVAPAFSAQAASFSVADATAFPFVGELVAARDADRIAWVRNVEGVRNIWVASGPDFKPVQVTRYTGDDGVEITNLAFSADGSKLVYVLGGDHDSNWPSKTQPNPGAGTAEPKTEIWSADPKGKSAPEKIVDGDYPALSPTGRLAYLKDDGVWTVGFDGKDAKRLFFDRGKNRSLAWSPDGGRLAFVSDRGDHSFIGVFTDAEHPVLWVAPTSNRDADPVWSPDGRRIAFTRQPGQGGAPEPYLKEVPHPWAIWTADAVTGDAAKVWAGPNSLHGSYPDGAGGPNLHWAGNGRLTFTGEMDNWPHLYAVDERGGPARLLTPGAYIVEHVAVTSDGGAVIYSANTGPAKGDDDRRHIFRVSADGGAPTPLTSGEGSEWTPVATPHAVAAVASDPRHPPALALLENGRVRELAGQAPPSTFAGSSFVTPRPVTLQSADGLTIHGQIFETPGKGKKPALVFVHGGPPRQMLLGWHYMDYYSHAYAMNQYYANHGYVVLSVNYRLGIGYGRDFKYPAKAGPTGASEYQDVQAAARYLTALPQVDARRIGIWGGSYGGYLTGLALARNSDVFAAGVDLHGVHDWTQDVGEFLPAYGARYEQGDREAFMATAWKSSPDADIATWKSPVLLIHGDDDRNVRFNQTTDLARRLSAAGVTYEELVLPDEIHGFLRHASWLRADRAASNFLARTLGGEGER